MTQAQVLDRLNKVMSSCVTEQQREVAIRYCRMLLRKYYIVDFI